LEPALLPSLCIYCSLLRLLALFFFSLLPRPPTSTLFPYTTLFRSVEVVGVHHHGQSHLLEVVRAGNTLGRLLRLRQRGQQHPGQDRKSTRLNSSHLGISYAVFCLKKKKITTSISVIEIEDVFDAIM